MAVKILKSTFEKLVEGTNHIRAEIAVDSSSDLTTTIGGQVLTAGSIAWDISTGNFYGLDSTGTWRKQGGEQA